MTESERWQDVCKPALERIDRNVEKLVEVVITGNGKPALTARVDALERAADGAGTRRKSVKVGPVEFNGYMMSDIIKVGVLVVLLTGAWLLIADRRERAEVLAKVKAAVVESANKAAP
jgi:hypothetical protein